MKIDNVDVDSAVTHARQLLAAERDISPALKSALEMILLLVTVLLNRSFPIIIYGKIETMLQLYEKNSLFIRFKCYCLRGIK
ncbi:hypothetical protein BMR02_06860 [Methylococcaceae bacterium HT1]|nr:hypothetical protein BMR02_06860 [Methylococcaceae bacterium HT1]